MKKNDKIVVVLGVIILVLASIGIYYYEPIGGEQEAVEITNFKDVKSVMKEVPMAVSVADTDPFYPLIATPVAVQYDDECEQQVIPLFVENMESPSDAIVNVKESLYLFSQEKVDGSKSAKEVSLEFADKFWESSSAALIIEDNQAGYELGVVATPIASYLGIPVIVTDEIDAEVQNVLTKLGVEKTIICGESIGGVGKFLKFETVEDICDATIEVLNQKFKAQDDDFEIDYITLTNPIDAFPPEVLDSVEYEFGPESVQSASMNTQNIIKFSIRFMFGEKAAWEFEIPKDYKYALIELEGYNLELDGVDEFGDSASFAIDPVANGEITLGNARTANAVATRDEAGNIIEDKLFMERVLYDCGGKKYTVTGSGSWNLLDAGSISAKVTVKKLSSPVYEMMGRLSSLAPYITAYHKGLVFGSSDFAFTADDNVLTDNGDTAPGYYMAGRNPALVPMLNKHVFDKIHEPLNELLAKLAGIPHDGTIDLESLTEHYKDEPVYIALVGGATVLPRYIYQNEVEPIGDIDGDGEDDTISLDFGGGGTQSDNIYANIDPEKYAWDNVVSDMYSDTSHPFLENIVGRICGFDVQDTDALIVRNIFYNEITEDLSEWKNNYGNLVGGGLDFRKPLLVQIINHIPGIKQALNLLKTVSFNFVNYAEGPWKVYTGFGEIMAQAIEREIGEDIGFNVLTALNDEAAIEGLSDDALNEIKNANLWTKMTFPTEQVRALAGEGAVKGKEILENSNFIWITGHGSPYNFGMDSPDLVTSAFDGFILRMPKVWQQVWKRLISPYFVVGFWGPGGWLAKTGEYCTREISTVDFGPSFMWLESCFVGRITGITPEASSSMSVLHSGVNALVASTTGSNIPGGYLPGKSHIWDTWLGTQLRYNEWSRKAEQGEFPEFHFGWKIYDDMCHYLSDDDTTVGKALRDAKNDYLPEDEDWELFWNPPLSSGGSTGLDTQIPSKYTSFHEYVLYGDPAFNPYTPE